MIAERDFTRSSILERLRATLSAGQPVIAVAAGVGIVGKCAEIAGADLIVVLASGRSRHLGVPTTVYIGDADAMTLGMYPEIDNVVERTPIIGGVNATDGTRRRLSRTVSLFRDTGFDGVGNFPTTGTFPGWGKARSDVGEGEEREFELIEIARAQEYFTIGFAYTTEHGQRLAAAGADVLVARCGLTVGGMSGPTTSDYTVEQACAHVQSIIDAGRAENADTIFLAHGGPFSRPEDTAALYAATDAQGFLCESSVERIPIEEGVTAEIAALKEPTLRESARRVKAVV